MVEYPVENLSGVCVIPALSEVVGRRYRIACLLENQVAIGLDIVPEPSQELEDVQAG